MQDLVKLSQNLNPNDYYMLSPCGLGDTYFLVSFIDSIKQNILVDNEGGGGESYRI